MADKQGYVSKCPIHKSVFIRDWRAGDTVEVYCPTAECPNRWTFPVPTCEQDCATCKGPCTSLIRELRLTEDGRAEFSCDHPCDEVIVEEALQPVPARAAS